MGCCWLWLILHLSVVFQEGRCVCEIVGAVGCAVFCAYWCVHFGRVAGLCSVALTGACHVSRFAALSFFRFW